MKNFLLLFVFSLVVTIAFAQNPVTKGGWKLTDYSFVDGTKTVDRVLAGTSDYMEDVTKFEGSKGDIVIYYNRYDKSSRKHLAGVNYSVKWTEPQSVLFPGDNIKMTYSLKTITNLTWKPEQQSAKFNQGIYGINLKNSNGEEFFSKDFSSEIISAKPVEKGYKLNEEKTLTVSMGGGFKAVYTYKWDPELVKTDVKEEQKDNIPVTEGKTGWYFTRWEYIVSSADGSKTGHFANGDTYSDVSVGIGDKNNFTTTLTRIDKNGKTIASGKAVTTWTDPPKYFSDTELPSITVKRTVESSWGISQFSISFDMAEINPGGGTAGKINFATPDAKTHLQEFDGTMKAPKIIKGNKHGDQRAIIFHFNGYGFKYYYEWRVY
ncbi:MAG TPA: hypothetical protein PKN32_09130 [Bacteroidales bacterium]|nr:hypothetical protein [Bacteroidales bacterium]